MYVSGSYVACYANLKSAFDAINAGTHTGEIVLKLAGSTIETASAILNASSSPSSYTSVHIYPTVTGLSITGDLAGSLINLNGADNVTIDGSVNEADVTKDLIITNTSISSATYTSAICFSGDASANTVKYCTIKGSQTSANGGIIFFTAGTTLGNNGNTIDHNDITCTADANRPISAIYSQGLSGVLNSGNIISNNNIFDFLNRGKVSYGINIPGNSIGWTISGNSFYETSSFVPTADVAYMVINIADNAGTNFTISNNHIGGSSASCEGTPWTKTAGASSTISNNFTCIYLFVGTGTASNIQGNEIRNFSHTDAGVTIWYGINVNSQFGSIGKVNIGTTTANTIGASTGTGSITYEAGTGSNFYGIWLQGISLLINVQNNVIGSITTYNTATTGATNFTGIYNTGTGTMNISGNTIGSTTTANSIYASSLSTSSAQTLYGINNYSGSGLTIRTISGNTISNMTNANTGTAADSYTCGIRFSHAEGTKNVTNNTIRDLSTACGWNSAYYSPLTGIIMEAFYNSEAQTVTGNTIYNLTNNYSSTGTSVCGILFQGANIQTNILSGNFIYNLSCLTPGNDIRGLILFNSLVFGTTTCANNILSLGGNTPANIYGLYAYSGSGDYNLYFNTVYIGGVPTSGTNLSFALYSAVTSNTRDFRNNIFMNARSTSTPEKNGGPYHYAMCIVTEGGSLTCDYNDYYVSGTEGMLGRYSGTDKPGLPIVPSQDANSLAITPSFTGAGGTTVANYKPGVPLAGVAGTGITTDYSGFTRLSPPTLGSIEKDNPLPVTLSSFTSNISGRNIKLNWITASEQNNSGFEVQRAVVGSEYLVFSKMAFVSGNGNTNSPTTYNFTDMNLNSGKYQYRLKQIDNNGNFEFHNLNGTIEVGIPNKFDLSQNYPNPFNPATKINFDLPADSKVTLAIYDVTGRQVTKLLNNELRTAGYYTMDLNGSSMASGIYFYRFIAESAGKQTIMSKRMTLIK